MQKRENDIRRANLRRIRKDQLRPLRVVETLDCSAVFEKSPTEIRDAYVISDRKTGELFLTILLRWQSRKQPEALDICILLYRENECVPYAKLPFRYGSAEGTFGERIYQEKIRTKKECRAEPLPQYGEVFGQGIYLPLPDSYFHKLQIKLLSVVYKDGTKELLNLIANTAAPRFAELEDTLQTAYSHINAFEKAEEQHPIRVMPTAGENAWLCCCGQKNLADASCCERCGRERDWQLEHLTRQQLQSDLQRLDENRDVRILRDTTAYKQNQYIETQAERKQKEEQYNRALERLAAEERKRSRRRYTLVLKIALSVVAVALLALVLQWLAGFIQAR